MAQAGLRSFYPVRRRREEDTHTANKRRKLTESSHLEVPSHQDHTSPTEADIQAKVDAQNGDGEKTSSCTSTSSRRTSSRLSAKKKQVTRKSRRTRKDASSTDAPNIKTLFEIIRENDAKHSAKPSEESPIPGDHSPSKSVQKERAPKLTSPFKVPSLPPVSSSDLTSKLASSPLRGRTTSISPFKVPSTPPGSSSKSTTPTSSPIKTTPVAPPSPLPESRGARLLRLATEKKAATAKPHTRSRKNITEELCKLSSKELARPTRYEARARTRRGKEEVREGERSEGVKSPKLRDFGAFVFESPTKKEAKKSRLPAYQRFHALALPEAPPIATPTKAPPPAPTVELPLPYSYQELEEKFHCTDTVVSMLQKRKEICTFDKLKKAVQEMSRRQFEQKNLGQMKTVYPTAFNFRQEKNIPGLYDNKQRNRYHLTLECRLEEEEEGGGGGGKEEESKKKDGGKTNTVSTLNPTTMIKRRKTFKQNLTEIAKGHHKAFLASLDPPLTIPDEKILRWHPAFLLDSVPEIEVASLPTPPIKETYTTAKDVLNVAQGRLAQRVQAALAKAGEKETPVPTGSNAGEGGEGSRKDDVVNPELKGVSAALLEKVRAKEAAKAKLTITRDPVKENQLEMLGRLPDFVRIVKSFFVTEKKAALLREDVVKKLVDSHPSRLPADKVESHLQYLIELVPAWIKSVKVSKGVFIKIEKKADLKTVMAKLERTKHNLDNQD